MPAWPSSEEEAPPWEGNVELIDCETGEVRRQRVEPGVISRYRVSYARHFNLWTDLARKVDGVSGEHFDEMTLGYERVVGRNLRLLARGIYRVLRNAWGSGLDSEGWYIAGNPGEGDLSFLAKLREVMAPSEPQD